MATEDLWTTQKSGVQHRGKIHEYMGMEIDYTKKGLKAQIKLTGVLLRS